MAAARRAARLEGQRPRATAPAGPGEAASLRSRLKPEQGCAVSSQAVGTSSLPGVS